MEPEFGVVFAISLIISVTLIYFLPAIIAWRRDHASTGGIFVLNLLLGWSGIIWIVALIWSLSNKGQAVQQTVYVNNQVAEPQPVQPIYIPVPQPAQSQPAMIDANRSMALLGVDTRDCPSCAETIKAAAIKCRFCGEQLTPSLIQPES